MNRAPEKWRLNEDPLLAPEKWRRSPPSGGDGWTSAQGGERARRPRSPPWLHHRLEACHCGSRSESRTAYDGLWQEWPRASQTRRTAEPHGGRRYRFRPGVQVV